MKTYDDGFHLGEIEFGDDDPWMRSVMIRLPVDVIQEIDRALEWTPLRRREDFVTAATRYALASLADERRTMNLGLE